MHVRTRTHRNHKTLYKNLLLVLCVVLFRVCFDSFFTVKNYSHAGTSISNNYFQLLCFQKSMVKSTGLSSKIPTCTPSKRVTVMPRDVQLARTLN